MIRDRWYAILESDELRPGRALGVRRLGMDLVVWRGADGGLGCMQDRCPHRGAALSHGRVQDGHVACPFHGFAFDAQGRARAVPAMGKGAPPPAHIHGEAWPLQEAWGFVWMWFGAAREQLPALPFFEELKDPSWRWATIRDPWPVHYTRAVENQLDVAHLPFVHATTIGRGRQTVVDGPRVHAEGEELWVWFDNRTDDGVPAQRAEDLPPTDRPPLLHFRHPALWQNVLGPKLRILASFTPVDAENTMLYVRYYQRMVTWPLLGPLVTWLGVVFSRVVLDQDKRVVVTQRPVASRLRMDERLIPGDRPIVEFRRKREEDLRLQGDDTAPANAR